MIVNNISSGGPNRQKLSFITFVIIKSPRHLLLHISIAVLNKKKQSSSFSAWSSCSRELLIYASFERLKVFTASFQLQSHLPWAASHSKFLWDIQYLQVVKSSLPWYMYLLTVIFTVIPISMQSSYYPFRNVVLFSKLCLLCGWDNEIGSLTHDCKQLHFSGYSFVYTCTM